MKIFRLMIEVTKDNKIKNKIVRGSKGFVSLVERIEENILRWLHALRRDETEANILYK